MEPILKIERYTHGVRISGFTRETFGKMHRFLEGLSLKEPKKIPGRGMIMELKKRYYGVTDDRTEVFIHRNCLDSFIHHMESNNVPRDRMAIEDVPVPKYTKAEYLVYEKYVLRDYQEIIQEDILREYLHSARVDLQTGRGKTLVSLASLSKLGCKALVMVPPKYFGIWKEALLNTYKDVEQRFVTISGSAELQKLIDRGLEDDLDDIDVIIMSAVTYRAYIDTYERLGSQIHTVGYNVPPPRFHEVIKVGCQINDEIQEDPGLVFRIDMYTNVAKQIYLSATPYTGNAYVTKMIDVMLPPETACRLPNYDVYINVMGILYSEPKVKPKDYLTPFKNTYNHARYETVMMKDPKRLDLYFKMVKRLIEGLYVKDRLPKQKMLLLCATVAFIERLVTYLKKEFPDLEIGGHVSGSPYAKLLTNDLTVSTIKSSGTGVDIPNLREALLLQATDSKKDNVQILGRLRKLRDFPDVTPRLACLVCNNIPHHTRYWVNKKEHFAGKTLNMVMRRIG
jgi:hypothetical protein